MIQNIWPWVRALFVQFFRSRANYGYFFIGGCWLMAANIEISCLFTILGMGTMRYNSNRQHSSWLWVMAWLHSNIYSRAIDDCFSTMYGFDWISLWYEQMAIYNVHTCDAINCSLHQKISIREPMVTIFLLVGCCLSYLEIVFVILLGTSLWDLQYNMTTSPDSRYIGGWD